MEDYRALPEEQRMELIDGVLYDMAAPTGIHQLIGGEIYAVLGTIFGHRKESVSDVCADRCTVRL